MFEHEVLFELVFDPLTNLFCIILTFYCAVVEDLPGKKDVITRNGFFHLSDTVKSGTWMYFRFQVGLSSHTRYSCVYEQLSCSTCFLVRRLLPLNAESESSIFLLSERS